jgi:hypothetical protein
MAVYAVTEVKMDAASGRVVQVKMGPVLVKNNEWMTAPKAVDVIHVVNAIRTGDDVFTIFQFGGSPVPGPKLKVTVYPDGAQGVMIDGPVVANMTLQDMPRF